MIEIIRDHILSCVPPGGKNVSVKVIDDERPQYLTVFVYDRRLTGPIWFDWHPDDTDLEYIRGMVHRLYQEYMK